MLSLVVFFGLMTYLLCTSSVGLNWRWLGSAGCTSTVLAVAFSRLYLEAHWISDVAGGFMLGLAFLLLTIWLVETVTGSRPSGAVRAQAPSLPERIEGWQSSLAGAASQIAGGFPITRRRARSLIRSMRRHPAQAPGIMMRPMGRDQSKLNAQEAGSLLPSLLGH